MENIFEQLGDILRPEKTIIKKEETSNKVMYLAEIPNICGYGILILCDCPKTAEKLLKKKYYEWRKSRGFPAHIDTYDKAIEYFDGGVREVELNRAYYDEFKY